MALRLTDGTMITDLTRPHPVDDETGGAGEFAGGLQRGGGEAPSSSAGFLAESDWPPDQSDLSWWLSVAGVQFVHRRPERTGEAGVLPWPDAVTVLESGIADDRHRGW
jgi:hypothetical protein